MPPKIHPETPHDTPWPMPPVLRAKPGFVPTVRALILREMATTYGAAPGGYLWAVLEPAAGIALLTFVFSLAFDAPPLGQSFPLFYATGFLVFMAYLNLSNKVAVAIRFSKPLLFYPPVRFIDPLFARLMLNGATEWVVAALVLGGIVIVFRQEAYFDYGALVLCFGLTVGLGFGVGTLNCALFSLLPLWERVWSILNRPMFVISTIFFLFEAVPHPYRDLLWFNPLVHLVGLARRAIYPGYDAAYVSILYVLGVSGVSLLFGLILLARWYRDIINN